MKSTEEVYLITVGEDLQADIIEEELKKSGIPVLKKYREGGAYLNIYMGKSMYGVDIFVAKESYEAAREILQQLGITDIEGRAIGNGDREPIVKESEKSSMQVLLFKVGMTLIAVLWLFLWWRSR